MHGLKTWAKLVVKYVPSKKELTKLVAWWNGQPVKFTKDTPTTPPMQSFEIWGKDVAKAHALALKQVMSV